MTEGNPIILSLSKLEAGCKQNVGIRTETGTPKSGLRDKLQGGVGGFPAEVKVVCVLCSLMYLSETHGKIFKSTNGYPCSEGQAS